MQATFSLDGFLGYIHLTPDREQVRPAIVHQLCFRGEDDPTVIVPPADLPVGLLYWDNSRHIFRVITVRPDQEGFR
jgi:hypothetical protein